MKTKQCIKCEYVDSDKWGFYCSILSPELKITNGKCLHFKGGDYMKKYELRTDRVEVDLKDKSRIEPGFTQIYNAEKTANGDTELIKSFDTLEEAKEELGNYKSTIDYEPYHKIYIFQECFIEENEYDEDNEWISGGDIWEFSEFPIEWKLEQHYGSGETYTINGNIGTMYGNDECFDTNGFYQYFVEYGTNKLLKCYYDYEDKELDEIDYSNPIDIRETDDFV